MPASVDGRANGRRRMALVAAITLVIVGGLVAGVYIFSGRQAGDRTGADTATAAAPGPAATAGGATTAPDQIPEQAWIAGPPAAVAEAFRLAFGGANPAQVEVHGFDYRFSPIRIPAAPG